MSYMLRVYMLELVLVEGAKCSLSFVARTIVLFICVAKSHLLTCFPAAVSQLL